MPRGRTRGSLREEEEAPATLTKKDLIKLLNDHMAEIQEQFRTNIASSPRSDNVVDVTPTHLDVEHIPTPSTPISTPTTRINVFNMEKLPSDVSLHDFITWRTKWEDFYQLERLDAHPLTAQMAALRLVLSTQMLQTVTMVLNISPGANTSPKMVLDALYTHIRDKRSIALDRVELEECRQAQNESFDDFYIRLRKIADCADLCTHCMDSRLTTRIICGIQDQEARKKLLAASPFPTLQAAVNLCRSEESAARNEPMVSRSEAPINKVYNQPREQWKRRDQRPHDNHYQTADHCGNCGNAKHSPDQKCPAKGQICNSCKKPNHFATMCRSRAFPRKPTGIVNIIGSINAIYSPISRPVPTIELEILNSEGERIETITATPDGGASTTVVGTKIMRLLGKRVESLPHRDEDNLVAANGNEIRTTGRLRLNMRYFDQTITTPVAVSPDIDGLLISWFACVGLGILSKDYPAPIPKSIMKIDNPYEESSSVPSEIQDMKNALLEEFADVFDTSGPLKVMTGPPMTIQLKPDAVPFALRNARTIPIAWYDQVKNKLDEMELQGIITPVMEPTDWTHPLVVVAKKDGTPRICVDLTKLNRHVDRPIHPLTTPKQAVSNISSKAKYFTTYDATHGYWQIPLTEESQALTTFITPWGRFKFLRGPMGLVSTGDEYCRRTDAALGHIPRLHRVVDDMLAEANDLATCYSDARLLLTTCRENNITLGKKKF